MNFIKISPISVAHVFILSIISVLAWQTFNIQVLNREVYQEKTKNIVTRNKNIDAARGEILDRNGVVFATNICDTGKKVEDFSRLYMQGKLASQIVGTVGSDGKGNQGLEKTFDLRLYGNDGYKISAVSANARREIYGRTRIVKAIPGKNLVLTIDRDMQEIIEKELKVGVKEFRAASASAIVVDPVTGEILAMASYPTFDPNSKAQKSEKNNIVSVTFEPGSTFKVITAAAALENGVVNENKIFENEGRCWNWNPRSERICDTHVYGDMDMATAMEQSSNVVFAKIADAVGAEKLFRMARSFGLGVQASGDLIGEESGKLKKPYELVKDDRTLKTMGFGHAVSVTPLQMAMVYAAIANGGMLMEPMIVKEWRDSYGNVVEENKPVKVRRVISEQNAAAIRSMLNRVVNNGTAKRVPSKKIPDVIFGGKTGTAEIFNQETKKYDKNRQWASFIGLAPFEDVRYVCMVLVENPNEESSYGHTGGATAGPIFRRIMERIYYHPKLSPASYALAVVNAKHSCKAIYVGMNASSAESVVKSKDCPVVFEGTGDRVVAIRKDLADTLLITATLGSLDVDKVPDFKGMSLRDAMEIAGNMRMSIEYSGMGRVTEQSPKPNEIFRKGQICKLTLKEHG